MDLIAHRLIPWLISIAVFLAPGAGLSAEALRDVVLQLRWLHQFQFAGYYMAAEKGYYREAGLNVLFHPGGPGKPGPVREILSGAALFGTDGTGLVKNRTDGEPVVALAAILQKSPLVWLVRGDSGIHTIQDLAAKRLIMLHPPTRTPELLAAFSQEGIDIDGLDIHPTTFDVQDVIDGRFDAIASYSSNGPWAMAQQGIWPRTIGPEMAGIQFYGDVLFTSQTLIDEDPDLVNAFLDASLKGWAYAFDNVDEVAEFVHRKYAPEKPLDHLKFEGRELRKLAAPDLVPIGDMNPGRWTHIAETYAGLGIIPKDFDLDGFLYDRNPMIEQEIYYRTILFAGFTVLLVGLIALWILNLHMTLRREYRHKLLAEAALSESQRTLDTLLSNMPGMAYRCLEPAHKEMRLVSRGAKELTGYGLMELVGHGTQEYSDLLDPGDRVLVRATILSALAHKEPFQISYRIKTASGQQKWVWEKGRGIYRNDGSLEVIEGFVTDVTDRERAEEQLRQAQKMEALGNLAGGIAHDLNNMLLPIRSLTALMLKQPDETDRNALRMEKIRQATDRATTLVTRILSFSRKEEGGFKEERIDLNTMLLNAMDLLGSTLPTTVDLKLSVAPDVGQVMGDLSQLTTMVLDLASNGVDAMEGRPGILAISLARETVTKSATGTVHDLSSGVYARLSIKDSGKGIGPEYIDRIFDPFFTTKEVGAGTGLGLATVHGIVSHHMGAVHVESESGQGAEFIVYLPLADDS
ncbi:ABC transporter substrate-binding protein [Magnetospira sp. QH-2]|uniref:ABC transporter substrate-binding protein n=1 Tax=Magnetospira sp. (strain QH-2) TaxID=1288970 RepID=UPI0003E80C8C|nr:ABC transporter substrate-binding protein [Magnetospira sp. QH-2]CCQ72424.1 putative multi-components sensory histidine kinase (ABC-type nitrate/sulfonate/bicarbonate transport systems (periplasmic components) : PYP-like sensor domain (PAS domain) : Histidine kinase domain) [Magnetospira sp. QH-2]